MPAPVHVSHISHGISGFGLLGGLLCLGAPLLLIVFIVRQLTRSQYPANNPLVVPAQPVQIGVGTPMYVRTMDDGFWITGDWPVGTPLRLSYLANGAPMTHDLIYRPGPDGHFFYTGMRPDSVMVVPDDSSGFMQQPAPLPVAEVMPPELPSGGSSGPPIYPSAY